MKVAGSILILIISLIQIACCQGKKNNATQAAPDTMYVSVNTSTYLAFSGDIELVDIGNKDYTFKVEKNILLIKSNRQSGAMTNMLVKFGGNLFTGILVYAAHPVRNLYDFRKRKFSEDQGTETFDSSHFGSLSGTRSFSIKDPDLEKKVEAVTAMPTHFRTFGIVKNSIKFLLSNLCTDAKYMYLSFEITNRSNLNYSLDYVSVEYSKSGNSGTSRMLDPVYFPQDKRIVPNEKQILVYVVPYFATGRDGIFYVTFRETNGNRKTVLNIPYRAIRSAINL